MGAKMGLAKTLYLIIKDQERHQVHSAHRL